MNIEEAIRQIRPLDEKAVEACWQHWDSLCKPLRGFGRLEELVSRIGGIEGTDRPHIDHRAVVIMGADNGVVAEGVSQTGSEVTAQVLENMGHHISSVCVMSRILNAQVIPVNIGVNRDIDHPLVLNRAVRHGTNDIAKGPAMTRQECLQAIETGMDLVRELTEGSRTDLLIVGEMGIGNTTTSAACCCVLFGRTPEEMTGRGAGLSTEGLKRKTQVVKQAVSVNKPDPDDPVDIMSKVGGLDIAGMTGVYLGAAFYRVPAMVDGVISGLSACLAVKLCPAVREYLIPSIESAEPAGKAVMQFLGLKPLLNVGMHLGEGTGAAAALPLLDQGLNVYNNLPSFEGGGVKAYEHLK